MANGAGRLVGRGHHRALHRLQPRRFRHRAAACRRGDLELGGFFATPGNAPAIEPDNGVFVEGSYLYAEGPVFLAHGTNDTVVPYALAQDTVDRAEAVAHPYAIHSEVEAGHGFNLSTTEFAPGVSVFQAQVDWLDSALVGVPETS